MCVNGKHAVGLYSTEQQGINQSSPSSLPPPSVSPLIPHRCAALEGRAEMLHKINMWKLLIYHKCLAQGFLYSGLSRY